MLDNPERDATLDSRLIQALEIAPRVHIPSDFARLVAKSAAEEAHALPRPRFGVWAVRVAFALLIVAMLVFAPWAVTRSTVPVTLEFLLAAEFVGLTCWLSLRQSTDG